MSPELLDPQRFNFQDCIKTIESDCYALGMVILEVLTGRVPFVGDKDPIVMRKATDGDHPKRPKEVWFTDNVWETLKLCWALEPQARPRLESVLRCLENASASWTTFSHSIPLANPSGREPPDPDRTVGQATSLRLEAMSEFAQEPTIHGASPGPDNAQVRYFICPPVPAP